MRLVVLFILLTTIHLSYSEDYHQEFDDVLRKGIMFNEESRILLAEKFIPVQFLVPFPKYNFSMKTELTELHKNLNNKWKLPSPHALWNSRQVLRPTPPVTMLIGS